MDLRNMTTASLLDPKPQFKSWVKSATKWLVKFPRRGAVPANRRYFLTEELAQAAIDAWKSEKTPAVAIGKRKVDELVYCQGLLPAGVTLLDTVRFYLTHHTGTVSATVKTVADSYRLDMKRTASAKYREEQGRMIDAAVAHFGPDTLFAALSKPTLLGWIKEPDSYWVRYSRKRAVRCLITKALELDAIKDDPLRGWSLEDAPKATPHILTNEAAHTILEHTLGERPELIPAFALQLFAGIRTEELCRPEEAGRRPLKWEDITFGEKINVPIEVSKTQEHRRITFWPAALTNWLNAVAVERKGRICPVTDLETAKSNLLAGLKGLDFKQNDFRRTYASNAVAYHGGYGPVVDWMGHSDLRMLKKHYANRDVDKAPAEAYFADQPTAQPANVIALSA